MNQKTTCPECTRIFEVPGDAYNAVVSCPSCSASFNPMAELLSTIDQKMQTQEFRASVEAHTAARIAEANKNVTHADFVAGVHRGVMGFKCRGIMPYQLIRGAGRNIFFALVLLYMAAP